MKVVEWECFSPEGPGQCTYYPDHVHHQKPNEVPEPGTLVLFGTALVIAWLSSRKSTRQQ